MRTWIVAIVLTAASASVALADGMHAEIAGPGPDGVTYTARTMGCDPTDTFEPWALAEGVVDGRRVSVLLRPRATGEHGVYQFERAWPEAGTWMIRYNLGHPPAPATVTTLRPDGTVEGNEFFLDSDGSAECSKALRPRVSKNDRDC